ncbi:MAG: phage scaffolding protein [Paludibacteraceae bacterium]|nr:phage scaffolding protein [Paludibacteraceae bacterium]
MRREDLEKLGHDKAQIDAILDLYGKSVNSLKETITLTEQERDTAKSQLEATNKKLEGYDPEWKKKAEEAQTEAQKKIQETMTELASERAVMGLAFSSNSAKKAFVNDLKAQGLKLEEGKFLGFDDFVNKYKETDPQAFTETETESKPKFSETVHSSGGDAGKDAVTKANEGLRSLFGRN